MTDIGTNRTTAKLSDQFETFTGIVAFQRFLNTLKPSPQAQATLWFKVGQDRFYRGDNDGTATFRIFPTEKLKINNCKRTIKGSGSGTPVFASLLMESEINDGGVFYLPGQPAEAPLDSEILYLDDIPVEFDRGTVEEQYAWLDRFTEVTGIYPSSVLTSGGKSIHTHYKLSAFYDKAEVIQLRKLLTMAMLSDPSMVRAAQAMRIPGFIRREKGTQQALLYTSENMYRIHEFQDGLKKYFEVMGFDYPEVLPKKSWLLIQREIKSTADFDVRIANIREHLKNVGQVIAAEETAKQIVGEPEIEQYDDFLNLTNAQRMINMVKGIDKKAGKQNFNLYKHDWVESSSDHARGCCPFHDSASKNSAWLEQRDGGVWLFHCQVCTDNFGLTYSQYCESVEAGTPIYPALGNTKKGTEWFDYNRRFLYQQGYDLTFLESKKTEEIPAILENFSDFFSNLGTEQALTEVAKIAGNFYDPATGADFTEGFLTYAFNNLSDPKFHVVKDSILANIGFKPTTFKKFLKGLKHKPTPRTGQHPAELMPHGEFIDMILDRTSDWYNRALGKQAIHVPVYQTFPEAVSKIAFREGYGDLKIVDGTPYRYDHSNGVWRSFATSYEKFILGFAFGCYEVYGEDKRSFRFTTWSFCKDAVEAVTKSLNESSNETLTPGVKYVGFTNGHFNCSAQKLESHNQEHYCTFGFDFDYEPTDELHPVYQSFLTQSYGLDQIDKVRAAAHMMMDAYNFVPKFIHLMGASQTGKGTFARLISSAVGSFGTSIIGFDSVSTPEKVHQYLTGKRFALIPDIAGYAKDLGNFYELISNGEVSARALYSSSPYTKKWNLKFMICSIGPLKIENSGYGWNERVLSLFTNPKTSSMNATRFDALMASQLQNFVCWVFSMGLAHRNEVIANWNKGDRSSEAIIDLQRDGDSVAAFLDECAYPDKGPIYAVNENVLYEAYKAYVASKGLKRKTAPNFISALKQNIPSYRVKRLERNGKKIRGHFVNIKIHAGLFSSAGSQLELNVKQLQSGGLDEFLSFNPDMSNYAPAPEFVTYNYPEEIPLL